MINFQLNSPISGTIAECEYCGEETAVEILEELGDCYNCYQEKMINDIKMALSKGDIEFAIDLMKELVDTKEMWDW